MQNLHTCYTRSVHWNTLESIFYHSILLSHQFGLYYNINRSLYGIMGIFFSCIYLCTALINFGLDASLSAFWTDAISSRKAFRQIISNHLIFNYLFATLFLPLLYFIPVTTFWGHHLSTPLLLIFFGIICSESIKKTCKNIIQLNFLNYITALVEICTIVGYTGTVWTIYALTKTITLYTILLPMLCVSCISAFIFACVVVYLYNKLPTDANFSIALPSHKRIIKNRLFNFINQISHMLFSGNVLIPLFALHINIEHIGTLKFISTIAHEITAILQTIFGHASHALFATTKQMNNAIKRTMFSFIFNRTHQAIYVLFIFFVINYKKFITPTFSQDHNLLIAVLYFIIVFSENFFLVHEKFFIAEEKSHYLLFINSFSFVTMYGVLAYLPSISVPFAFLCMVMIRLTTFIWLSLVSYYTWRIKPTWQMQPTFGLSALVFSLLFFFIW